ncbi:MAG: hypothetical protein AMJ81_14710 [Phycisphaerae bacterium SM23_33]|nr:MAG: hypothetical protein AMJ81_14710 [Phycisphaerae bacterium SM23_33]
MASTARGCRRHWAAALRKVRCAAKAAKPYSHFFQKTFDVVGSRRYRELTYSRVWPRRPRSSRRCHCSW